MKYYIIAGEASGDLHGSNLMRNIKKFDPDAHFRFWGGDLMLQQGSEIVRHFKETAIMGGAAVLMKLRTVLRNMKFCKQDIIHFQPDALILIDYAGFNLRIAEYAHNHGLKCFYYISPKVWAWRKKRAWKIKRFIHKMFVILPFEVDFYKSIGYKVNYVGNPLVDAIESYMKKANIDFATFVNRHKLSTNKKIIALLAGSRKQEIDLLLPIMVEVAKSFQDFQFVIAGAPSIEKEYYNTFIEGTNIKLVYNCTYDLLSVAHSAIVTSGTATLETALFRVPEVVVYKTVTWQYRMFRSFVKFEFFSLVNLIMGKEIVREFLQFHLVEDVRNELNKIVYDVEYRNKMLKNYELMIEKLGGPGASEKTAAGIVEDLKN